MNKNEIEKKEITEKEKCKVSFSKLNKNAVSIEKETNKINLKYINSKNINIEPQISSDNKIALYKNVEEGIDLKYELEEKRLKESFIVNQRNNFYSFNFDITIGDLEPFYNEATRCLELKKNNAVIYRMLPPYMYDSKGQESNKCFYEIENIEDGLLTIQLIADAEWINSEDRELPIIIDPTFEFETDTAMFHVSQSGGSVNILSDQDEVFIGYKNQDNDFKFYSFQIDIDWSQLPNDISASDKNFYLEMPVNYNIMDENDKIVVFANGNVLGVYKPSQLFNNNILRLDVSESFKSGENGSIILRIAADGLLARAGSEYYESKTFKEGVYKASLQVRDSSGNEMAKLIVEPKQESKQYVEYDMGVSGVTSVNIQTGRYKHRINDLSINSGLLTLNISHIFDSKNNSNGVFGQKWGLSICRRLVKETLNNGNKAITYIDEDGVNHYFIEKWFYKNGNTKMYVDIQNVTLSEDNELVTRNGEPVEYEIINDEGYEYISLGSATNYDAKRKYYKYYLNYNGFKKPVIEGQNNYLQFVYYANGSVYYVDNAAVEYKNRGFVTRIGNEEKRVYLSSESTAVNFNTGKATIYYGANKSNSKEASLQKVTVYENLDEDIHTSSELENLEYEMNQAKYNLNEINKILTNKKTNELSVLNSLTNIDVNIEITSNSSDGQRQIAENNNKLYSDFLQFENELISAYEQLDTIERNEYFLTRSFNSKLKEQKNSANDYIIDTNGNILLFDGYGRFVGLMDTHESKIEISYDGDSNIEEVNTNEERILFKYKNNKLEMMKKTNGDTVRFNYFFDNLVEIDNNGRKTTFTYFNGLQVYSDINDEVIVDTQTTNTIKVKKYVEPGTINETKVFQPFVDRTLVQNDKYEYSNNFNVTTITDRIKNEVTTINFDFCGEIQKQEDEKYIALANYYKEKPVSMVKAKRNPIVIFTKSDFNSSNSKYSLASNAKRSYPSKTDAYCLKVVLNDLPSSEEDLKAVTLSTSYTKGGETYSFKQTYVGKDNETLVLPFFIKGEVSNLTVSVETNLQSQTELTSYINDVSVIIIEEGSLYEYDNEDRLWKIKNNGGKTTYLSFEGKLPIRIEFKDWNGKTVTTDCVYNEEGKLISSVDSKGNVNNYLYSDNGKTIETKEYNLKDASLVRSSLSSYDDSSKTYSEIGGIKDSSGKYPSSIVALYPGTDIVKTIVELDGNKTEYNIHPLSKKVVGLIKESDGLKNSISYIYNRDFLTTVKDNETEVNYTYDGKKRIKSVKIKGYDYNTIYNTYSDDVAVTDKQNNSYSHGSIISTTYNGTYTVTSKFTKDSNLLSVVQGETGNNYSSYFAYNDDKLLVSSETIKEGENSYHETVSYSYNERNHISTLIKEIEENEVTIEKVEKAFQYNGNDALTQLDLSINNALSQSVAYSYNDDNLLMKEIINGDYEVNYGRDALGRINHREIKIGMNATFCHTLSYLQQDGNSLDLIAEDNIKVIDSNNNQTSEIYRYSYDVNGRVVGINIDNKKIVYKYDSVGRLISEHNELLGVVNEFAYDKLGNIISRTTHDLTDESFINHDKFVYSCDNKHLLVAVNDDSITYDTYGRMASYRGKEFIWNNNGTLKSVSTHSNLVSQYVYNDQGIRYKKALASGDTVRFILDGNKILKEEHASYSINYLYNINGLLGFVFDNEVYIYERNIFGDIIRIYSKDAEIVGEYKYDAFGNVTIVVDVDGIASINPFRYRGYYFDNETGLYYLNYRYYDPSIGRFISPDDISYINPNIVNGLNIYAYCGNDPINKVDPNGHFWISLVIGLTLGIIVGFTTAAYSDYKDDGVWFNGKWQDYVFEIGLGAITGAIGGGVGSFFSTTNFIAGFVISATLGAGSQIISDFYYGNLNNDSKWYEIVLSGVKGGIIAGVSYTLSFGATRFMASREFARIVGSNTSNHHINQALARAGLNGKIGQVGKSGIIREIMNSDYLGYFNTMFNWLLDTLYGALQ